MLPTQDQFINKNKTDAMSLRMLNLADCPSYGKELFTRHGWPYVLFVICIFVILVVSFFSFEGRILVQIVSEWLTFLLFLNDEYRL